MTQPFNLDGRQLVRMLERKGRANEQVKSRLPKNMAKLEARVAKLEGRIRRIEENPDPTKPASNKLLYRIQADRLNRLIQAWKTGNPPFAGIAGGGLGKALGFEIWSGIGAADRSTPEEAKRYFDIMRRQGFNPNSCDRTIAMIPMVLSGEYPAPDFLSPVVYDCVPMYLAYLSLANLLGIPLFAIDHPPVFDERALAYVTRQFEQEIDYLQTLFPGHKYNEDMLLEQQEVARIWYGYQKDIYQLRKRKPCPLAGIEAFREKIPPFEDMWEELEYERVYRDELFEKAEKGDVPTNVWGTDEKLRLCWAVSGPFYYDPFTFLNKLGVSVPIWVISDFAEKDSGRKAVVGDPGFGRKLTPLEEVARAIDYGWGDRSDYYINSILNTCRDLELDGIVFFKQPGCAPTMPLGSVVDEAAERELGIPTLQLEGRQLDQRGFNEREFLSKLVDFCNACLARKHLPPLTKRELEKAGYNR